MTIRALRVTSTRRAEPSGRIRSRLGRAIAATSGRPTEAVNFLLTASCGQRYVDRMDTVDDALDYFRQMRSEWSPLAELQADITRAIWHAAERQCGAVTYSLCGNECCSAPGTHPTVPSFDAEAYKAQRADERFQRELHLAAVSFAAQAGQDPKPWVMNARAKGVTWQDIARVLGLGSKQAAQQRYGTPDPTAPRCVCGRLRTEPTHQMPSSNPWHHEFEPAVP